MTARAHFLDLDYDTLTQAEAERWLGGRSAGSDFAYVVTPNVDHVVRLEKADPAIRRTYAEANLCLCDSRVLARVAKFAGVALTVVPGSDLVAALFAQVLRTGDRICLIGGSAEDAAALNRLYPKILILHHSPPMGLRTNAVARAEAAAFAAAANARFTLLAVGSPQQELLAWEMRRSGLVTGTALCIGASIDFLIGTQSRAPRIVRRAELEWAWRLLTQPRRLARRYLVDGPAIFPIVWRWRKAQRTRKA
jgi:N-acetylglucosaminyldiphosphoundecaprenol N-acetyl-beta-D-mannosaminyltransferase